MVTHLVAPRRSLRRRASIMYYSSPVRAWNTSRWLLYLALAGSLHGALLFNYVSGVCRMYRPR
jgi:hypothetical protein